MFQVAFHHPQLSPWLNRLNRIPRWGWIALGIGVVLPIVVILLSLFLVAVLSGLVVLTLVAGLVTVRRFFLRLRAGFRDDGRRNVRLARRPDNDLFP